MILTILCVLFAAGFTVAVIKTKKNKYVIQLGGLFLAGFVIFTAAMIGSAYDSQREKELQYLHDLCEIRMAIPYNYVFNLETKELIKHLNKEYDRRNNYWVRFSIIDRTEYYLDPDFDQA